MKRFGLTVFENSFCEMIALGKNATDAYCEAFGKAPGDERARRKITVSASKLSKRLDIAERIIELKGEIERQEREKWRENGNNIANNMYSAIEMSFNMVDKDGKPMILDRDTLKAIEVLAKMKGLNAPEETVLKNGGSVPGAFVPRGVEGMSEDDLKGIIEAEGHSVSPIGDAEKKGE